MHEWQELIQISIDEIDGCIKSYQDEALTLRFLSRRLGYSEFYTTRKFKEITGMQFREYLRSRRLAFALKEVRDGKKVFWILPSTMVFLPTRPLPERLRAPMA